MIAAPAMLSSVLALAEGPLDAHAAPELRWAGLALLLPLVSGVLCLLCGWMKVRSKLPAALTIAALGGAFATILRLQGAVGETPVVINLFDWISWTWGDGSRFHGFTANVDLYIDRLTVFWMLFVTGLGTLIALYASEYMESDVGKGYTRFFGAVSIFLFAMGCLVMGGNLLMLYLGWEGVGLASYLLIGYYFTKPEAVAAAKKAFIVNRIGDLGLALALFLIWQCYGTVEYAALWKAIEAAPASSEWSAQAIPWLLMLGAFVCYMAVVWWGLDYWVAFAIAIVAVGAFGAFLDATVLRRVIGQPQFAVVMLTIGLGSIFRTFASVTWGSEIYTLPTPFGGVWRIGGVTLSHQYLSIVLGTLLLCGVLYAFFNFTRVGVAMQATSQNQLAAYYMGVPVKLIFSFIWAISAGVATAAGVLLAPVTLIDINMGLAVALKAFAAAVLGGFGSIPGALVGGIVIGLIELYAGATMPDGFKDAAPYVVLLVMLAVRPQGLFGSLGRKKV